MLFTSYRRRKYNHLLAKEEPPSYLTKGVGAYTSIRWDKVDYIVSNEESQILLAPKVSA